MGNSQMSRTDGFAPHGDSEKAMDEKLAEEARETAMLAMKKAVGEALARLDAMESELAEVEGQNQSVGSTMDHTSKETAEQAIRAVAELRLEMVSRTNQAHAQAEALLAAET